MPKLSKPPKYAKVRSQAVVYLHGKVHYLGKYGSPESKAAYARLVAEYEAKPVITTPKDEVSNVLVRDLAGAFLEFAELTLSREHYGHNRILVKDFLLKLYGDEFPVDGFRISCLKAEHFLLGQQNFFKSSMTNPIDTKFLENKNLEGKAKNNNFHKNSQC